MFLDTDHSGLNKFDGANDENFALLLPEIRRMVKDAPLQVTNRLHRNGTVDKSQGHAVLERDTAVLTAEKVELHSDAPFLIPFPRDPHFVERGTLLDQIHEKGTLPASRVALVGLGGVGYVNVENWVGSQENLLILRQEITAGNRALLSSTRKVANNLYLLGPSWKQSPF